jgi:hypothetical protein
MKQPEKKDFNKSMFDDQRKRLAHHHVKLVEETQELITLAAEGDVLSAEAQLRILLDDMERIATGILSLHDITVIGAVTMPANTTAGRAGRLAQGVQDVRRALVSPEAIAAALTTYRLMQQVAAASLDEWREEIRRGVDSVESRQLASHSSKLREGYAQAAKYMLKTYRQEKKPSRIWKAFATDGVHGIEGCAVRIIDGGKKITHSKHAPITQRTFIEKYLKPAQKGESRA